MEQKNKHTLLLVDDEESITNSLKRLFRREGVDILTASNARDGLEILKNRKNPVSLIISDQRMPEMTGDKFLEKAKQLFPDAIRFLISGYADMEVIIKAVNKGEIHRYITKPWNDNDLLLQVRQALEQYDLANENRRLLTLTQKQNEELNKLNKDLEKKVEERSQEIISKNKRLSTLNNELESNLYDTVRAFASLTEMHAPSLAGHGRRVGHLSREIATLFELSDEEITQIEIAGLLHDTGKIGLTKKLIEYGDNNLSPEEKELFKRHPEEGQGIIRFIKKLDHVGLLVRSHHERYDGEGYPDQLKEDLIPLGAKIIAVADSWDKITRLKSNAKSIIKVYLGEREITQDEMDEKEVLQQSAIHYLKQNAFIIYDPDVVKVFLNLIKTKGIKESQQKILTVDELKNGMILGISLYTTRGRFLLPHKTTLTSDLINKLKAIHKIDPIREVICVMN